MKSLKHTLALAAFAIALTGTPAFAADATTSSSSAVTIPHPVRCLACGAPHDVVVSVGKENTLDVKLVRSSATGNPRGN